MERVEETIMGVQMNDRSSPIGKLIPKCMFVCCLAISGCVLPPRVPTSDRIPQTTSSTPSTTTTGSRDVVLVVHREGEAPAGKKEDVLPPPRSLGTSDPAATDKDVQGKKEGTPAGRLPAPQEPGSTGLTFQQVILACLNADPKIHAALEQVQQARGDFITSSLKPNPELFSDIQLLPLQNWTPERTGGPPQFDFQVAYPIDWWLFGKRVANMKAADQGIRVSDAEYADLVRTRVTDAAVAYYDVLESLALVDVAKQDLENYARVETSLEKAVKLGGRPRVDLSRIRLDKLKSAQAVRDAEAALDRAKSKLKTLIGGGDITGGVEVSGSLDLPSELADPPPLEQAFAVAQEHRPDIYALRWKVCRAEADVDVEDRRACPEVKPMVGYTHQFQKKPIGQPDADSFTLAISTSVPWHDKNQGNRFKARSVLAQRHHELRAGLIDLRAEVEQALVDYRLASRNSRAVAREQLQLAREVRESISTAYNTGGKTLLDFLDAQRNYRDTYRLYNSSRADYWRSVVRLLAVTGKQELLHGKPTPTVPAPSHP